MKKFFWRMLSLATALVLTASFASCGGSDDNDSPAAEELQNYEFTYTLSNDYLTLCDVKVVVTVGKDQTELKFDQSVDEQFKNASGDVIKWSGKKATTGVMKVKKSDKVKVESTLTPKSDWQTKAATQESWTIMMKYAKNTPGSIDNMTLGGSRKNDKITEDYLTGFKRSIDYSE